MLRIDIFTLFEVESPKNSGIFVHSTRSFISLGIVFFFLQCLMHSSLGHILEILLCITF